jgi:hypothetical protein
MSSSKGIEIENFVFNNFRHPQLGPGVSKPETIVLCTVKAYGPFGKRMGNEQKTEALQILEHMGQWEHLVSLLSDLGFGGQTKPGYAFGRALYDIRGGIDDYGILTLSFRVEEQDALTRTKGEDNVVILDTSEIEKQIANIPKWHNVTALKKALSMPSLTR